ncbi:MAG TPA: DNA primase [Rhodanobacteraceae bacterium]|nr:DNA primase [Rhodanobacteraceae bacterium]
MAGLIPENFIDELLARLDIVEVIERRVPLKKAGREWQACCPFHNERTPSFTVSPSKQFYHCFGCGAHGSAIKFLMDYEHLEFPDAVEELAASVGLQVPHEASRGGVPREQREDLYSVLADAAGYFRTALASTPSARAYAERRGLDAATCERFGIGWAPREGLLRTLGSSPEKARLLDEAGMLSSGDRGQYDRFRERLMFPIQDRRGRVIAFGGRVVKPEDTPKYLNSPETPLFHKGRELFGLWQVKQAATALKRIVVVEGYMDVIALHQAGLPIAVATLGTATTGEHAERLFRSVADVVFAFDGDRAGRAAAWRALESVLPHLRDGRQAWFLFLPDGEDPDSLVRKEGKDGFNQRLDQATPLSSYFFDQLAQDIDLSALDGRARLAERAKPLLAKLPEGAFADLMQQELRDRSGIRLDPRPAAPSRPMHAARPRPAQARRSLVRSVIALLMADPRLTQRAPRPYPFAGLQQPGMGLLVDLLDIAYQREDMTAAMLIEHFRDREEAASLHKLALIEHPEGSLDLAAEFDDALIQLQRQAVSQRIADLTARETNAPLDAAGKQELRALLASKVVRHD